MRSRNSKIARTVASVLMSLLFLTVISPAATKPISAPEGLALDSKGNLYVANLQWKRNPDLQPELSADEKHHQIHLWPDGHRV